MSAKKARVVANIILVAVMCITFLGTTRHAIFGDMPWGEVDFLNWVIAAGGTVTMLIIINCWGWGQSKKDDR